MKLNTPCNASFQIRQALAGSALSNYPVLSHSLAANAELADEITRLFVALMEPSRDARSGSEDKRRYVVEFVDPVTGLNLLPKIQSSYQNRSDKTQLPDNFIAVSDWGPLASRHLLYSEHMRRIDPGLYEALRYRAEKAGQTLENHLFALGIFCKGHIARPPEGFERQANLMKALRAHVRATSLYSKVESAFPLYILKT